MSIRAKLLINEVTQTTDSTGKVIQEVIKGTPVVGKENEPWSKWTPSGVLSLTITNPEAFNKVKGLVYCDIIPCEEPV